MYTIVYFTCMKTTKSHSSKKVIGFSFYELLAKFPTEESIITYFIKSRYGKRITCPNCGEKRKVYQHSKGAKFFNCKECSNSFSIFTGTIFENTKLDLRKWVYAISKEAISGKKGVSGCQLQREIGVTYKTAWRILKQIRIAMANHSNNELFKAIIEVDETYIGGRPRKGTMGDQVKAKRGRGTKKTPVVGVLDRETGKVYAHVMSENKDGKKLTGKQLLNVIEMHAHQDATIITDQFRAYRILRKAQREHHVVDHSKEYVSKDGHHTNNIENYWSLVKRVFHGTHHHFSVKYMQTYLSAEAFRYSNRDNMENIFDMVMKQSVL